MLLAVGACAGEEAKPAARAVAQTDSVTTLARDARVDAAAHAACLTGDSLLQRLPNVARRWSSVVPFDSVWHADSARWACRVIASGNQKKSALSVDALMRSFTARGWSDRTQISADGPDGTVQAVHHAGVTCVIEGRWDGGDDSDSTYVPSDTIEVRLACTRTMRSDTMFTMPANIGTPRATPRVDPRRP